MSVWGIPFAGCLPRVQGCREETFTFLTYLFGDGENLKLNGEPVREGHGLKDGYLVKNTDSLRNMFGGGQGELDYVQDGHEDLKEYSDLWGNGKHVMRRFRANLDVGWRVFTELCWANLRRWRRLATEWRATGKAPSPKDKLQLALIGETTDAMATILEKAEGVRGVDAGLMRCKVCSTRVVNVRMMCGHAVCSDCFIGSAARSAENGAYVSSRCPSCNTHRCLAVEMGPHVAAQGEELRVEPSIGRVTDDMIGGFSKDDKECAKERKRLREWNKKLQLGRRAGSWVEREWLFGELEEEACQVVESKGPDSQAARVLKAVAILHRTWARATDAGEKLLAGGTEPLLVEFEGAMQGFDRAAAIMRNAAEREDSRDKYREALILGQKGYTYAMVGGRAAGDQGNMFLRMMSRDLLKEAEKCHKEAGRVIDQMEGERGSKALMLGHLASIKYSLAGVGVEIGPERGPKTYLEGAVKDFECQLQVYNFQPSGPEEVDDPTSNTHFAISDAARLNIVALRLCLGFWDVILSRNAHYEGSPDACGRFQAEAERAYKAAAQVVDERISREGQLKLPCGQTCNVGAFERILSVVRSAHDTLPKHGLLDRILASLRNAVQDTIVSYAGQEGDGGKGGVPAAQEALANAAAVMPAMGTNEEAVPGESILGVRSREEALNYVGINTIDAFLGDDVLEMWYEIEDEVGPNVRNVRRRLTYEAVNVYAMEE